MCTLGTSLQLCAGLTLLVCVVCVVLRMLPPAQLSSYLALSCLAVCTLSQRIGRCARWLQGLEFRVFGVTAAHSNHAAAVAWHLSGNTQFVPPNVCLQSLCHLSASAAQPSSAAAVAWQPSCAVQLVMLPAFCKDLHSLHLVLPVAPCQHRAGIPKCCAPRRPRR